ncbi:YjbQ family protein [Patescibacteria group bacterium]|nr:YjbQ family protein [Patescibacteria group bacterium]MCL5409383.1 YjbQ family protein [Patescibacteria group bacterium]
MKAYLREVKFASKTHTYFKNLTSEVKSVLATSGVQHGLVVVNSKHTTLGLVVQEIAEPHLLEDIVTHALNTIPEDKRSSHAIKDYPHPTTDYLHRCQDNPYCNEIDEDYNAASHIRSMLFAYPSVMVPVKGGELQLGKYQEIAAFEFDGRDGTGKNPVRQRAVQIWIYTVDEVTIL